MVRSITLISGLGLMLWLQPFLTQASESPDLSLPKSTLNDVVKSCETNDKEFQEEKLKKLDEIDELCQSSSHSRLNYFLGDVNKAHNPGLDMSLPTNAASSKGACQDMYKEAKKKFKATSEEIKKICDELFSKQDICGNGKDLDACKKDIDNLQQSLNRMEALIAEYIKKTKKDLEEQHAAVKKTLDTFKDHKKWMEKLSARDLEKETKDVTGKVLATDGVVQATNTSTLKDYLHVSQNLIKEQEKALKLRDELSEALLKSYSNISTSHNELKKFLSSLKKSEEGTSSIDNNTIKSAQSIVDTVNGNKGGDKSNNSNASRIPTPPSNKNSDLGGNSTTGASAGVGALVLGGAGLVVNSRSSPASPINVTTKNTSPSLSAETENKSLPLMEKKEFKIENTPTTSINSKTSTNQSFLGTSESKSGSPISVGGGSHQNLANQEPSLSHAQEQSTNPIHESGGSSFEGRLSAAQPKKQSTEDPTMGEITAILGQMKNIFQLDETPNQAPATGSDPYTRAGANTGFDHGMSANTQTPEESDSLDPTSSSGSSTYTQAENRNISQERTLSSVSSQNGESLFHRIHRKHEFSVKRGWVFIRSGDGTL